MHNLCNKLAYWVVSISLLQSACTVGPNFRKPQPPQLSDYGNQASDTASRQILQLGKDIPGQWWTLFQSKAINQLIERALKHNPSLKAAQAALNQANETALAQRGALFPSVDASFSDKQQQVSGALFGNPSFPGSKYTLYNASVQISYSLDIFGGVRRQIESLNAQSEYQKFQLEGAFSLLAGNVVTSAIQEAGLRAQIAATEDIIHSQEEFLNLLNQQWQLGAIAKQPVLAQQTQLEQTKAALPVLEQNLAKIRHQLAVLTGMLPTYELDKTFQLDELTLPDNLPLSLPSKLVQQRPDIRAQEALLHSASAQIGVVNASILPDITLSASIGSVATHIGEMFMPGSMIWNVGGNILQPVFRGGEFVHKRKAAVAVYQGAAQDYKSTVLQAFQNVVDVLSALEFDAKQQQILQTALDTATENLTLAENQYRLGSASYLPVLDAQRSCYQVKLDLAKTQASRLANTAALMQALGGGWWNRPPLSTVLETTPKRKPTILDEIKQTFDKAPPQ